VIQFEYPFESTPLDPDEAIDLFPSHIGNGRHARLMTDCLLMTRDMKRFSWGANYASISMDLLRTKYIDALRKADRSDYSELLSFVRA